MAGVKAIAYRSVLNSHVRFTNEFTITLSDGSVGQAASPQGETISIYEDRKVSIEPCDIIQALAREGILGAELDQATFDRCLEAHIPRFGRNNAFSLSEAFFNAQRRTRSAFELFGRAHARLLPPRICFNILNGGWHAYTNPVLSDFSEFMLVARAVDIHEAVGQHNEIQRVVKERQLAQEKTVVSGNPVSCFSARDNRAPIEFLLEVVENLGYAGHFDLMIDASAGDLWEEDGYCLGITGGQRYTPEQFVDYWLDLLRQYPLNFLEDPFYEKDFTSWASLSASPQAGYVIGDNLYSSDEARILEGARKGYANGAVIKPNQAGTVSAVQRALEAAQRTGQVAITSHRSISTESTFLTLLTCVLGAPYIKIGPLASDYSSIVRLNEIIRLTEESDAC